MASLQMTIIQQTNVSIMQTKSHTAHPAGGSGSSSSRMKTPPSSVSCLSFCLN